MALKHLLTTPAVLLTIQLLCGVAQAQAFLPEDNLAYPVQIVVPGGGGTGFFVRRNREVFLVTAMHVLFDLRTGQLQSREATLRALSKDVRETAVTVIRVNAAQLQDTKQIRTDALRTWLLHVSRLSRATGWTRRLVSYLSRSRKAR